MGQKIIPISLRLNKNKNWNTQWTVNKSEYSKFLFFDLEIQNYFQKLFNYKYFKLIKLNILKMSNNINIYIYIHQIPPFTKIINFNKIILNLNNFLNTQNVKLFIRTVHINDLYYLQKNIKIIFKFFKKNNRLTNELKLIIYLFSYSLYTRNINLILNYIKQTFSKKKTQKRQIKLIVRILETFFKLFKNFLGFRLQLKGRINGAKRKKKIIFQKGKIPLNSIQHNIKYNCSEFYTPSGNCSIKLWIFLKKK